MSDRDAPIDFADVARRIEALPRDEQEVVLEVLRSAERGLADYGPLDVDDGRDWHHEAFQEHRDAVFYLACESIRMRRRNGV